MSEKRISYICIYCGEKSRRRVSMGEPPEEVCPKRKGGEMHVWIDIHEVSKEYRIKFQKSKYPIAEYMYYVACQYAEKGDSQDIEKAISLHRRAAEFGHVEAMFALGKIYQHQSNAKALDESIFWYQKAAEFGCVQAMLTLGEVYQTQSNAEALDKSLFWYKKSAEQGLVDAILALGNMSENGIGVQQNIEDAEHWYIMGANAGDKRCKLGLGRIYELKNEKGKAKIIYKDIAESVAVPPLPLFLCGTFGYALRSSITKQRNENKVYDMACRGYEYEKGIAGVAKDDEKAMEWYQKAAHAGDVYSLFYLGNAYSQGNLKNEEKAFEYYRKAAIIGCGGS